MNDGTNRLGAAVARVWGNGGNLVGGAFLVTTDHLLTAAHVVSLALDIPADSVTCPGPIIKVDFPLMAPGAQLMTQLVHWVPPGAGEPDDVAGLRILDGTPEALVPAALIDHGDNFDLRGFVFGFPAIADSGVWSIGRLRGQQARGWVQIDADTASQFDIQRGFSGVPVWDADRAAAIGMVTNAWRGGKIRSAYMLPSAGIFAAWPQLRDMARPPSPFPGLRAFSEDNADVFFGREQLTDRIVRLWRTKPVVTVIGPSGVGKSSLLRAGVLPNIGKKPESVAIMMRPSEAKTPLRSLALALQRAVGHVQADVVDQLDRLNAYAAQLADNGLRETVEMVLEHRQADRLLLVIDQFEEVFACNDEEIDAFGHMLAETIPPETRTHLLVGLRSDFLGVLLQRPPLAFLAEDQRLVTVGELSDIELRRSITGPVNRSKVVTFEEGLVNRIIDDVKDAAGRLPLVQFVLSQLWERQRHGMLVHSAYTALGGARNALARHAEEVWNGLGLREQDLATRLLAQLVHPLPGREGFTRRSATRFDLNDALWEMAGRLATARIVVVRDCPDVPYRSAGDHFSVELAHEALLTHWERLRRIAQARREFRLWQDSLRRRIERWQGDGHPRRALAPLADLREARQWERRHGNELSADERRYLSDSRTRWWRIAVSVSAVVVVLTLVGSLLWYQQIERLRQTEVDHRFRQVTAKADEVRGTDLSLAAQFDLVAHGMRPNDPGSYTRLVNDAAATLSSSLTGNPGPLLAVAFSPDGHTLAAVGRDSLEEGAAAQIWDTSTPGRPVRIGQPLPGLTDTLTSLVFGPDGKTLVASNAQGAVLMWDTGDPSRPRPLDQLDTDGAIWAKFSPDATVLATGYRKGAVRLWDTSDPSRPRSFGKPLTGLAGKLGWGAFSPDGKILVACDSRTRSSGLLWDIVNPRRPTVIGQLPGRFCNNTSVAFSADGDKMAIAPHDNGTIWLWDTNRPGHPTRLEVQAVRTGDPPISYFGHINSMAFSPDGSTLASGGNEGEVHLWNVADPADPAQIDQPLTATTESITSVAFNPTGTILATSNTDRTVRLWNLTNPTSPSALGEVLTGHADTVNVAAFSPDGTALATGSNDATVRLWHLPHTSLLGRNGRQIAFSPKGGILATGSRLWDTRDPYHPTPLSDSTKADAVVFSSDGTILATTDPNRRALLLWDISRTSHPEPLGPGIFTDIAYLTFRRNDSILAATDHYNTIYLLDIKNPDNPKRLGRPLTTGTNAPILLTAAVFSPDGNTLITSTSNGSIQLWDTTDPSHVNPPRNPITGAGDVTSVAVSPDGATLVAGTGERTVRLWDISDPHKPVPLGKPQTGHTDIVHSVAFSPDGDTLATASRDGTVRLWDVSDPANATMFGNPLTNHAGFGASLAFSPDGSMLASGAEDITLLWHLNIDKAILRICNTTPSVLTYQQWQRHLPDLPYQPPCP